MAASPFIRFLVVGGGAALLELATFQALVLLGLDPVAANALSFLLGMTSSFIGYRIWSFAGDHTLPVAGQFGAYATLAGFNAVASSVMIHALIGAGLQPWTAKAGCMALIAAWNFLLLNRLIFRRHRAAEGQGATTGETAARVDEGSATSTAGQAAVGAPDPDRSPPAHLG